jgi:hypothetical protein
MIMWTPPGFLTLDEMFSRVGSQMFDSLWTGNECLAGMIQPPEYWRDQELARRSEAIERKAHAERALHTAASVGGSPFGRNSSNSIPRRRKTPVLPSIQGPDWRSETYAREYREDQEAAARYRRVAKQIIEMGWHGTYLIFVADPSGHFLPVDRTTIQSEAFQGVISKPGVPNRERLLFLYKDGRQTGSSSNEAVGALSASLATNAHKSGSAEQETADAREPAYLTGLAGRPTSWPLIEPECRRRYEAGERHPGKLGGESRAEWANRLIAWLKAKHPHAAVPKPKGLTNKLAGLLHELEASTRPKP